MTAYRAVVLEHFRRPRNRGPLAGATGSAEGANPLCGDRIRVQVVAEGGRVVEAKFTADACALCIASASLLTEGVRGAPLSDIDAMNQAWLESALGAAPPAGRAKCVVLPLETLHRAIVSAEADQ